MNYKVWHPLYIRGLVEGRDSRLGVSADIGHWRTSHLDSVECLRILEGRIISVHLKDKEKDGNAPVVTVGTGVVDVAACLEFPDTYGHVVSVVPSYGLLTEKQNGTNRPFRCSLWLWRRATEKEVRSG